MSLLAYVNQLSSAGSASAAAAAVEEAPALDVVKSSPPESTFRPVPPEKLKVPVDKSTGRAASVKGAKVPIAATAYSVADLQAATNSFGQESLIGEGALGRVYRGDFPNGKVSSAPVSLCTPFSAVTSEPLWEYLV